LGLGGVTILDADVGPGTTSDRKVWGIELGAAVSDLTISPDGTLVGGTVTTQSDDELDCQVLSLWRTRDGKKLYDLQPKLHFRERPSFSLDGRRLASLAFVNRRIDRDQEKTIWSMYVWDPGSGRLLREVRDLRGDPSHLAMSADGRSAAYARSDGSICVVELATGRERVRFAGDQRDICAVAFSSCGRYLATASAEAPILIWDLYPPPAGSSPRAELWANLANDDAAFLAMRRLVTTPNEAVTLFREHIGPVRLVTEERVRGLMSNLDSKRYAVRNSANVELQRVVDQAEAQLTKHSAAPGTSAEARRQIQRLLEHIDEPTGDFVVRLRALEVLEQINTPAARALVAEWATGAPAARFTQEAKATLARMKR
jgi:hypothetical protein